MSTDPQYQVEPEGFWLICQMTGADGYSTANVAERLGWRAIGSWGRDGWDLGSQPLVIVFHRERDDRFDLATYVEGDIFAYSFPTQELRDSATDEIAFFYWEHYSEPWVVGLTSADQMPAHLRGPYSRERADHEREVGEAHLE